MPVRAEGEEFERWKRRYVFPHRRPGFRQVLFPVPHGNLPADQAIGLADFLEPFGPDVLRGTREQNLLLRHIPESHLGNVYELLKELEWADRFGTLPWTGGRLHGRLHLQAGHLPAASGDGCHHRKYYAGEPAVG